MSISPTFLRTLLLFFLSPSSLLLTNALLFTLPSGKVKCFIEDLPSGAMSIASFTLHDNHHNISAQVMDPKGADVLRVESVESHKLVFVAAETGKYSACFWTPVYQPGMAVTVDFEWKTGIAARDWTNVAKKGKIEVMELELKKLENTLKSIHEEMIFLRSREAEAEELLETTASRMNLLSLLSFILCIGVAGLQFWHLKSFFIREKIL